MTNIPETLHHYTTAAGLLGIFEPKPFSAAPPSVSIRSLSLWASDARYLNDSKELSYAAESLADAMLDLVGPDDAAHTARIHDLAANVRQGNFIDPAWNDSLHSAYVTSFCGRPDLLSQWRGYGAGGYSIGFPTELLNAFMVPLGRNDSSGSGGAKAFSSSDSWLFPVQYTLDESIIERVAHEIVAPDNYRSAVRRTVECLAQFKHPAFEAEEEWRLIWSSGSDRISCDYRISPSGMLIPYLQLRYTPSYMAAPGLRYEGKLVESVWVGPSPDQKLRAESVSRMLRQRSFPDVAVEMSPTPFRG